MIRTESILAAGFIALITGCLGVTSSSATAADAHYDLVLRNARIVDGTGSPWYRADVAVRGDTIVRIAPAITDPATRVIDIGGLVAAPGFIDIHTHASRGIFQVPTADNYVRQGVTTVMEGPDGGGSGLASGLPVPLKPFLDRLEALPKSINIGSFIGQGAVREAVHSALDDPPPDPRLTGRSAWLPKRNPDLWEQSDDPALDDLDDRWTEEEDDLRRPAAGAPPAEPRSARCARALAVGCQAAAWWFCRQHWYGAVSSVVRECVELEAAS